MSLNNSHYGTNGVLLYNGERILIYYDGVELALEPDHSIPIMKGNKKGRIYLTSHRIVFVNKNMNDTFQSFSMPFFCMRNLEIEQPVFGANYIKGEVKSEPQGRWDGIAKFKLWFNNGGAIDFGSALMRAGTMASQVRAMNQSNTYSGNYEPPSQTIYAAPPPAYMSSNDYGWVPLERFPDRPPENSVFMYDAPPPYSGIYPNQPQQNVNHNQVTNGFYNPSNPNKVYAASSAPPEDELPPPYHEKDPFQKNKKD